MIAPNDICGTAAALDRKAVRILRRRSAVDLALGETLLALFEGDRLLRLGYAKPTDYAREALGLPARTMRQFTRLARGLQTRPALRSAVAGGQVSMRKALLVMDVATGDAEEGWALAASRMTERELRRQIRAAGGVPPEDPFDVETIVLRMDEAQQDRLDVGIEAARVVIGEVCAKWKAVEAMAMEYLSSTAYEEPEDAGTGGVWMEAPPPAAVAGGLAATAASRLPADPRELDERARRLVEIRTSFDSRFGPLLRRLKEGRVWVELGYPSWDHYLRDHLGISPRTARQRLWLERKMDELPELRVAFDSGLLTYTKTIFVAKDATSDDVGERIARAAETTLQQVERESDEREERQNRAAGVRRLWGPKEAFETVSRAISACQKEGREKGEDVSAGEALARMADHFVEVWGEEVERKLKRMSKARREVMLRHGGLCAFPGCTRPAMHDHHLRWKSHGGSNDASNRIPLCAGHHLRTIHWRWARVSGTAGERLDWVFGSGEEFVTLGDDDVVRVA